MTPTIKKVLISLFIFNLIHILALVACLLLIWPTTNILLTGYLTFLLKKP